MKHLSIGTLQKKTRTWWRITVVGSRHDDYCDDETKTNTTREIRRVRERHRHVETEIGLLYLVSFASPPVCLRHEVFAQRPNNQIDWTLTPYHYHVPYHKTLLSDSNPDGMEASRALHRKCRFGRVAEGPWRLSGSKSLWKGIGRLLKSTKFIFARQIRCIGTLTPPCWSEGFQKNCTALWPISSTGPVIPDEFLLSTSRIRCFEECWRECQNCHVLISSSYVLSSRNTIISWLWNGTFWVEGVHWDV